MGAFLTCTCVKFIILPRGSAISERPSIFNWFLLLFKLSLPLALLASIPCCVLGRGVPSHEMLPMSFFYSCWEFIFLVGWLILALLSQSHYFVSANYPFGEPLSWTFSKNWLKWRTLRAESQSWLEMRLMRLCAWKFPVLAATVRARYPTRGHAESSSLRGVLFQGVVRCSISDDNMNPWR